MFDCKFGQMVVVKLITKKEKKKKKPDIVAILHFQHDVALVKRA